MYFTKIGTGVNTNTKKGKTAIKLTLDKDAQKQILNHDFENGVWLFKSMNSAGKEYWSVNCPMPDNYKINYDNMAKNWAKKFEKKHETETNRAFDEWTKK